MAGAGEAVAGDGGDGGVQRGQVDTLITDAIALSTRGQPTANP
jgi:hypothetical protein